MMKPFLKILLPGLALLLALSAVSPMGIPSMAEEGETEAATTVSVPSEEPRPNAEFLATPVTVPPPVTVPTPSTGDVPETTAPPRTTAIITPTTNAAPTTPDNNFLDIIGWLSDLWAAIGTLGDDIESDLSTLGSTIGGDISTLGTTLGSGLIDLGTTVTSGIDGIFTQQWEKLKNTMTTAFLPLGGQQGMLDIIEDGGRQYGTTALNDLINALYEVFYLPGVVVMVICFCYSMAKGCYTLSFSGKDSIVQPVIGMIVTLFAFTMAKEIMTALYTLAIELTDTVINEGLSDGIRNRIISYSTDPLASLGYTVLNSILQLILMVNIAKIALMQAIAPFFIGFAPAENTRRMMFNLLKEYGKCCLVPPVTAAYALIMFCIADSNFGLFSSIVIGFSLFSMASKYLDKLIN